MPRRPPTLSVDAFMDELRHPTVTRVDAVTEAMLDATSALLTTYGMKRWSMDDVAQRSGLGRTTVYRRFDSRDDLVHATLARDTRRLFEAIAATVSPLEDIEAQLVEGLLVGLRAARSSLIPLLVTSDPAVALSILTAPSVLAVSRSTLVEVYEALTGARLRGRARAEVELLAEMILRLAMSFVLMSASVIDLDDEAAARRAFRRVVGPLLAGRR